MEKNNKINIAILGATGHIAKNLVVGLHTCKNYHLQLFARNQDNLRQFLIWNVNDRDNISIHGFDEFMQGNFNVIINCIGIGNPTTLIQSQGHIFGITEKFDNLILDYLHKSQDTLYINFSSGAAYGSDYFVPATIDKQACFNINDINNNDFYSIAKLNAEAKHRAYSHFNIVDLRIFGFFSRFIDMESSYFINDLLRSVKESKKLVTSSNDMIRDYIHPIDLLDIIDKCIELHKINDVFDVYSMKSVSKFELIDYFMRTFNIEVDVQNVTFQSPTGNKLNYYSNNNKLEDIGYKPTYSSLDTISIETKAILNLK
ncbi:NAD(P)-dependent oxidoreductase [Paenibacillus dendritiformis]|uniref:NAD-dependent epimerase/dehydratase family protein n=1 Tax=Paenibacillus dendritiformis TaxID=130049 RepID=UPI00248CC100|nr:NAD(P)-dependent oxidoreductase [Paenibacillus dendritiformis]WGU93822.1 NAD(P)-dependent oxidoreductase [Paenibacillus dendritiformis]